MTGPGRGTAVRRWWGSHRRLFGFAAAVWLSFGVVQVAQSYVYAGAVGRSWDLTSALVGGMPWWLSWLALTPLIAVLAERYPFTGGRRWRPIVSHTIAAVSIACVQLTVVGAVYWWTTGHGLGVATSLTNQIQRFFGSYGLESVVTYGAAAGVLIAIDFARAARDEGMIRAHVEARAAVLEASVTRARLDALAMELNPHFLFNTLTAISGLIAQGRGSDAREVIRRLGGLLRQTLSAGNGPLNPVCREVQLLEDYLFIQAMRFSDRLRTTLDIDEQARDCLVPVMLFQPLVENAIRHGIEPTEGRGEVQIHVSRLPTALRICISDSGAGFVLDEDGRPAHEGVGISNTRARLQHLYGNEATLTFGNRANGGAEAVVLIPMNGRRAPVGGATVSP